MTCKWSADNSSSREKVHLAEFWNYHGTDAHELDHKGKAVLWFFFWPVGNVQLLAESRMDEGRNSGHGTGDPTLTTGLCPYIPCTSLANKRLQVGIILHSSKCIFEPEVFS